MKRTSPAFHLGIRQMKCTSPAFHLGIRQMKRTSPAFHLGIRQMKRNMCYVNLLESRKQYIAYTHESHTCHIVITCIKLIAYMSNTLLYCKTQSSTMYHVVYICVCYAYISFTHTHYVFCCLRAVQATHCCCQSFCLSVCLSACLSFCLSV